MNSGRQAIVEGAFFQQRRDGIAHRDNAGTKHHGRLLRENSIGDLHGGLRIGLIVMEDELQRLSADAALFVDRGLKQLQRLLLALS